MLCELCEYCHSNSFYYLLKYGFVCAVDSLGHAILEYMNPFPLHYGHWNYPYIHLWHSSIAALYFILYDMKMLVSCSEKILWNQRRIQHELEVSTKQAIFVDSSISDTIRTCIVLGNHRAANKVKTEFKVSWFLKFLQLKKTGNPLKEDKSSNSFFHA